MSIESINSWNTYSLKGLLEKYFFIIPEYQRGYAQGRDNERDMYVLDMFVKEISEMISSDSSEDHTLHLDYVYGDIEERNGISFFYPVDGQQRLTTLFLFYVWCYQSVKHEEEKEFLRKLKYDIQPTSNKLISCLIRDGFKEPDSGLPAWKQWVDLYSEIIKDPTSVALLRAYRKIEKVLGTEKKEEYKENLEKITFEVVDTKKHSLPKTVFWKMNARGRALTQSEVFKAAFFVEDESAKNFDGFVEKLFCLIHGEDNDYQIVEKTLMNIVNIIFEGFKEIRYQAGSHEGFDFWGATYITKDEYLNYQSERNDEINQIFSALQKKEDPFKEFDMALPEYVKRQRDDGILNCLVKNSGLTRNMRALFFSYLIALPIESESLKEWMRVCSNLIWNSSDGVYALKTIYKLKGNATSILEFLSEDKGIESELNKENNGEIETNLRQYEEEKIKASAILKNEITREDIERAENLEILKGKVSVLLDIDGARNGKFKEYCNILAALWNECKESETNTGTKFTLTLLPYYMKALPETWIPVKFTDPETAKDMLYNSMVGTFKEYVYDVVGGMYKKTTDDSPYWIRTLCGDYGEKLIEATCSDNIGFVSTYWGSLPVLWSKYGCTWHSYNNVVLSERNEYISKLLTTEEFKLINTKDNTINNVLPFFKGWEVLLEFEGKYHFRTEDWIPEKIFLLDQEDKEIISPETGAHYCVNIKDSQSVVEKARTVINKVQNEEGFLF